MLLSSTLVPNLKLDSLPPHLCLQRVMIENRWHMLHAELISCVTKQQICFTHGCVSHEDYIESLQITNSTLGVVQRLKAAIIVIVVHLIYNLNIFDKI